MSYKIYTTEHLGGPRNYVRIFVETNEKLDNGITSGRIYHVTGTILMGMVYETRREKCPELDETYVPGSKKLVGEIRKEDFDLGKLDQACKDVEPPGAQLKLNGQRKEPTRPIRRCGEWVEEVLEKVIAEGLVFWRG